ncbi:uncharacterized protein RSE6_05406 [Rhynchosporium secalis]|uniref:Uncharacterized protein n=1 Tax=Rhynchosporium secalis TaxID=38038 RepID=A0A1E1M7N8_RHYSE|nr:uncharacterized protein RSE6_05406 [Rhynchosporium secalis]
MSPFDSFFHPRMLYSTGKFSILVAAIGQQVLVTPGSRPVGPPLLAGRIIAISGQTDSAFSVLVSDWLYCPSRSTHQAAHHPPSNPPPPDFIQSNLLRWPSSSSSAYQGTEAEAEAEGPLL